MMRASTVWHVIDSVDPAFGGTTRAAVEIGIGLANLGVCTKLVANSGIKELRADPELSCRIDKSGLRVTQSSIGARLLNRFAVQPQRGDIMHVHGVWEPLLWRAAGASRSQGVPYIVFPHGMLDRWSLRRSSLKKRLALTMGARNMLSRACAIQCLTEQEVADIRLLRLAATSIRISNGVWPPNTIPSREEFHNHFPNVPVGKRILLFMARIHPKKGLSLLIEALLTPALRSLDWVLVVAGSTEDSAYAAKCRELSEGISERTFWVGHVSGSAKAAMLAAAHVFVLPSFQEGFSLSILEALSVGLPVIVSRQCNFPELTDSNAGLIVDTTPSEISQAISWMLAQKREYLEAAAASGRELIDRRYSWSLILQELLNTYRQFGSFV